MPPVNRHVLIIGPSLRYLGGQAVSAQRLLTGLRTLSAPTVEYLEVDPVLPGPLSLLQRFPVIRTLATSVSYIFTLLRRVPSADTLHIYSAAYWSFLIAPTPAILIGRLFGKRVIVNYKSGEADDHLTRWGWHAKPLLKLADEIVVPTAFLVGVFSKHGLHSTAIPNHIDVSIMTLRDRSTILPRFFANRNFERHYNVSAIIEAFAQVQEELPEAELVIAGNGPLREELWTQAQALKLRNVRFTGPVQPSEMPALYAEADVYVNASLIDNMPLSLLEAYAAELPVVTSDAGGIPWIARNGDTATVVPAGDVQALVAAMLDAVTVPDAAQARAARARQFVSETFSWDVVRSQWLSVYAAVGSNADGVSGRGE